MNNREGNVGCEEKVLFRFTVFRHTEPGSLSSDENGTPSLEHSSESSDLTFGASKTGLGYWLLESVKVMIMVACSHEIPT